MQCNKCDIPYLKHEPQEKFSHYIGNNLVEVIAYVEKGQCPRCGGYWEAYDARERRNEAFKEAIDNFWRQKLEDANVDDVEMASVIFVVSRLMMKVGREKKRLVSAELGRWLADCHFL